MAQESREPYTNLSHLARHALVATYLPLGHLPKLVAHAPVRAALVHIPLVCDCAMAMKSLESLQWQSCTGSPAPWVDYGLPRPPPPAQVDSHARCPQIDNDTLFAARTLAQNRTWEISRPAVQYSEHSNVANLPLPNSLLLLLLSRARVAEPNIARRAQRRCEVGFVALGARVRLRHLRHRQAFLYIADN